MRSGLAGSISIVYACMMPHTKPDEGEEAESYKENGRKGERKMREGS